MKCAVCHQFGGPHRMQGMPCAGHANRVCQQCWKQHIYGQVINEKTSVLTCAQFNEPLVESQLQEAAKDKHEYLMALKAIVAAQKTSTESSKLPEKKQEKNATVEKKEKNGAGGEKVEEEEGFVIIEKSDTCAVHDDEWDIIDEDDI